MIRVPLAPKGKNPIVMNWNVLPPESPIWARVATAVPDCNWGLRLDDFVVADCDSPEAVAWWLANCPDPTGWVSQGRPGRAAFWYTRPADTQLRTFRLRPDLEIRTGNGAQQVVPPSVHPNGMVYQWLRGDFDSLEQAPLAPELWILEQIPSEDIWAEGGGDGWDFIPEGHRDIALTSLAGQLRRHGASMWTIETVLGQLNQKICRPPLADEDLHRIAKSVARYKPGQSEMSMKEVIEVVLAEDEY